MAHLSQEVFPLPQFNQDVDKLDIISFYLTDDALQWWDWTNQEEPIATWMDFERQLHTRFSNPYEDAAGEFTKLRKVGSVKEY